MKFDTTLLTTDLSQMPTLTQAAEAMGFDTVWDLGNGAGPILTAGFSRRA